MKNYAKQKSFLLQRKSLRKQKAGYQKGEDICKYYIYQRTNVQSLKMSILNNNFIEPNNKIKFDEKVD